MSELQDVFGRAGPGRAGINSCLLEGMLSDLQVRNELDYISLSFEMTYTTCIMM